MNHSAVNVPSDIFQGVWGQRQDLQRAKPWSHWTHIIMSIPHQDPVVKPGF